MAQMTFDEITTAVKARSKRSQSTVLIEGNNKLAVDWLSIRYNFPKLQTTDTVSTTASAETTAVPTLFKEIYDDKSVTLHETGKLEHLEILHASQFFEDHPKPDEDSEGEPYEIAVWANSFLWYPIPDAIYTIRLRYHKYHGDFSDSVEHFLGEESDRAIIAVSTAMTYEAMMELEDANYWYGIAVSHMVDVMSRSQSGIALARPSKLYRGDSGQVTGDKTDYGRLK